MKRSIPFILIVAAVFAVYAPALRNGFVWDDTALVLRDPLIRSWRLIPEGFNHFLFTDATASDFYRPVQRIVYTLIYGAFAFNPVPYHVVSVLVHAAAALMLFVLLREFLSGFDVRGKRSDTLSLIAALVWAVHPVHNAAVDYVSGIADPLAAFFGFGACIAALRIGRPGKAPVLLWIVCATVLLLLSALSKESGFVFVAIAAALLGLRKQWRPLWKFGVGLLFVVTVYGVLRASAEHNPAPEMRDPPPMAERPLTIARAFAEYTGLMILPVNLHMDRQLGANPRGEGEHRMDSGAWRELQSVAGFALLVLVGWWAARAFRRNRAEFVLLVCGLIAYLPVSGVRLLNAAVAEHWIYLPSAFLLAAVVLAIRDRVERHSLSHIASTAMCVAAIAWGAFLSVRSFVRAFDWHDQRTFIERTIAAGGDSPRMLINLGGLELSENHLDKAKAALEAALKKEPDQPIGVVNLAAVAIKQSDFQTAHTLLNRATQFEMVDGRAYELLAVLDNKERGDASLMRMRLASRTGPPDWSIERRYIRLLDEAGSTIGAIREVEHCLATEWYRADSWLLLGELLNKAGQRQKAADAFALAQRYDAHLTAHAL